MDMESQTFSFEPGYMLKFMLFQLCDLDSLTLEYVFTFKTPFIVQSIHAYPCPACNKRPADQAPVVDIQQVLTRPI